MFGCFSNASNSIWNWIDDIVLCQKLDSSDFLIVYPFPSHSNGCSTIYPWNIPHMGPFTFLLLSPRLSLVLPSTDNPLLLSTFQRGQSMSDARSLDWLPNTWKAQPVSCSTPYNFLSKFHPRLSLVGRSKSHSARKDPQKFLPVSFILSFFPSPNKYALNVFSVTDSNGGGTVEQDTGGVVDKETGNKCKGQHCMP